MSESFLDLESWPEGITAARIPANNNVRSEEAFRGPAISATTTSEPGSPSERDIYIIPAAATGTFWSSFAEGDVAIFYEATWTAYEPFDGLRKFVIDEGEDWQYVGGSIGSWSAAGGGGGSGDVVGPASSVDNHVALFDGLTGKLLKDGGAAPSRTPAVQSVTSSSTVTPTFSDDIVLITAQAAALALANPTGTAIPNLGMVIRIKDNGTARAITYDTQYRAIGVTLPTTTVISKTLYLAMIYNSTDTKWDVLAVGQEA